MLLRALVRLTVPNEAVRVRRFRLDELAVADLRVEAERSRLIVLLVAHVLSRGWHGSDGKLAARVLACGEWRRKLLRGALLGVTRPKQTRKLGLLSLLLDLVRFHDRLISLQCVVVARCLSKRIELFRFHAYQVRGLLRRYTIAHR